MIDIPPSMKPQTDTATIKWMRHLLPYKTITNTFTDMLISKENQEPFIIRLLEDHKLLTSIANNSCPTYQQPSSSKQLKPELLYNTTELSKLCQMRDIFLEFDADRSRTLEIKELLFMFNSNGIPITAEELVELFTEPGKKKKNIWEYKISFLDFIKFALDYECEEKFRKIKEKIQLRHNNKLFIPLTFKNSSFLFTFSSILSKLYFTFCTPSCFSTLDFFNILSHFFEESDKSPLLLFSLKVLCSFK
jgi:hypothetical protein